MKILIVSDSHQHLEKLISIFEKEKPEVVISAGDNSGDTVDLSYIKDEAEYYIVRGNCDFYDYTTEDNLEFELKGRKFFLTHGHLYGVKQGYDDLKENAKKKAAEIVIFGHTHIPYIENKEVILFNPGAAKDDCYGIIELEEKEMKISHRKL